MAITALPTPPSSSDPANFSTRADALLGALPTFVTEANALQTDVNSKQTSAATSETNAAASAAAAEAAKELTIAASGATQWSSGSYNTGDVVWSPSSFLTYRAKTTGSKPTDPALDGTNWRCLNGDSAWQIKTTTYTAQSGDRIMANTTSAAWTLTLPASPTAGTKVTVSDYAGKFGTNNLTVARNGSNMLGTTENYVCDIKNETRVFEYIDATQGWRVV